MHLLHHHFIVMSCAVTMVVGSYDPQNLSK